VMIKMEMRCWSYFLFSGRSHKTNKNRLSPLWYSSITEYRICSSR
jgi:hypothetical protein